jgi:hypothetical protein
MLSMARSSDFPESAAPSIALRSIAVLHRAQFISRVARIIVSLALALVGSTSTTRASSATSDDPYPPVRHASVVRFFALDGDVKAESLRKAVAELSTKDVESRIVGDPAVSSTHPKLHFLALETPAAVTPQDAEKALRKSNARVQSLEWTTFLGAKEGPTPILGYSGRDCVIGMSNDMRWFDYAARQSAFYYVPGKLRAAKLEDLYRKLYQPLGGGDLGHVGRITIQWTLKLPVDDAAAKRAEKSIAKLDGVREVKLDATAGSLRASVELDGLKTSASMTTSQESTRLDGGKIETATIAGPRFDTNPLLDALAKESIAVGEPK